MTTVHATISRGDYNQLYTRLEQVIGTSDGADRLYGWGQTMNSSGVGVSDKVSVEEYGRLITDMYNAYRHIYGSNPPTNWGSWPNNISTSQKIKANTVTNDATYNTQPHVRWNNLITALEAAKYTIPPAAVASSTTHTNGVYTGTWTTSAQIIVTFSWPTAADARHFFNSGGQIQLTSSLSSISGSDQDASWTSLLQTASTQSFGGQQPATGINPNDNGNFFRCTNVYSTPWYSAVASSPYNANFYRLYARTPSVLDNSSGDANVLEMTAVYNDDHVGLGGPSETGTPTQPSGGFGPDIVGPASLYLQTVTRKATGTINLYPTGSQGFNIQTPSVTVGGFVVT
jgi:hypothetical protein